MVLSSTGSNRTWHLAPSVSGIITLSHPCQPPPMVFPKAPFSILCFPSCTLWTLTTPFVLHFLPSLNHHFCVDDTQLFFSFYPPNFDSSITTKCPSADLFLDDWLPVSQSKAAVLKLLTGQFWGFLPHRGDTLHQWEWYLALLHAKFHPHWCNNKGIGAPKVKFLLRFNQKFRI